MVSAALAGLLLLPAPAQAASDKDFMAAREAYAKGQNDRLQRHAARIPASDPLRPHVDYWLLRRGKASVAASEEYLGRHPDGPLAERVREDIARQFGQNEDWPAFRLWLGRLHRPDVEMRCYALRARLAGGEAAARIEGARLYLTGADLPAACAPLFARLFSDGSLDDAHRHARLRLALEQNNLRLARDLLARLPEPNGEALARLAVARKKPNSVLDASARSVAEQEVALYALGELAGTDPRAAARRWAELDDRFGEAQRQYGWARIARHAARQHLDEAIGYFQQAGANLTEEQQVWKIRAQLRDGRWLEVLRSIALLPEASRNEAGWRYWKGRALQALGSQYQANQIFAPLSREFGYYGLLAEEELPGRIETRPPDYRVTPDDLREAERRPGLRRAFALRKLGLNFEAALEWDWAIRDLDDRQLLAAAELARREAWHDRAINTAEKTRDLHNLDLRYLTPYRDLAEAYAREHSLDPAWVYGLMRQESRFMDYARSRAGAGGLMQIMPATAKWIARQLNLDRNAHKQVHQPETNIRFGTFYLSRIQNDLAGSPVLATAGYNAGPGRARRWQAETPLEGAIYVESIPFQETRDYVKKVLANAMYYSHRLGQPGGSLKERLGVVPARRAPGDNET